MRDMVDEALSTSDATEHTAANKNPEQPSTIPVAESQALPPEGSDAGVAPRQDGRGPESVHDVAGLMENFPEINPSNYGDQQVMALNQWGLEAYDALTALTSLQSQLEHLEEVMVLRDAGISTAAMGYWKRGDSIHSEYLTPGLKDVADLYEKYAQQAERIKEMRELLDGMANGESSEFLAHADAARNLLERMK